ncbi:MAG: biopolymer transporter ExbD [Gemmatimonadetes bacterium]|nr:biopolymer transporter ExbD [Gemmatimonadota bacterium]
MALFKKRARAQSEIPTASMADIAFLLLIFFLTTTIFDEEKGLPIVLPEAQEEVEVSQKNILHLVVQPDGIVEVKRGESPQIQRVRYNEIEGIWRFEVTRNPNLIAAVKTHPEASYRHMVNVLDELQSAGAERISLQMLE